MAQKSLAVSADDIIEGLDWVVFTVDSLWRIRTFNAGAERLVGRNRQDVRGRFCYDIFQSNLCRENCPLRKALSLGTAVHIGSAVVFCDRGAVPVAISAYLPSASSSLIVGGVEIFQGEFLVYEDQVAPIGDAVQACETQSIIKALEQNNNNRTAAARELGIHKSTFFRKIKALGITLPDIDGRFTAGGGSRSIKSTLR